MIGERVILTGASGALGHNIATLLGQRQKVELLCLRRTAKHSGDRLPLGEFLNVDFHNRIGLRDVVMRFRPDTIIHCAASGTQFPKPDWFELVRFNVDVTLSLCECASMVDTA